MRLPLQKRMRVRRKLLNYMLTKTSSSQLRSAVSVRSCDIHVIVKRYLSGGPYLSSRGHNVSLCDFYCTSDVFVAAKICRKPPFSGSTNPGPNPLSQTHDSQI